jgi:hypothetical protein
MTRGLGYLLDAPDARDFSIARVLDSPFTMQEKPSLRHVRGLRLRQKHAGACVAFAIARCIYMSLRLAGEPAPPVPAPGFIYVNARRQEHAGVDTDRIPLPPLIDKGSRPRLAMSSVRKVGFCRWEDAPYDPDLVNQQPPLSAYQAAYDQAGFQYYRVFYEGMARIEAVRYALRAGFPVGFGMTVDRAFLDHIGSESVKSIDPSNIAGGHMMAVMEVEDDGTILVDNWWDDWGFEDGHGRISADLFASNFISDVYAIQAAPMYSGESPR